MKASPHRTILHVDLDAFFASVEQRDDPRLRGRPVVVGGASKRGVVCAASYEARPFGVRSAMPMGEALRRCPNAVVVPPRHAHYADVSHDIFAIFRRYTPLVEGLSLDEAFLDVTASRSLFGDGAAIARRIKDEVRAEVGLVASAGVAQSKFVAKIASDLEKPDALVVVPEDVAAFLAPLPVERMWGLGPKTAEVVKRAGYRTLGDLARATPERLERLLGSWGREVGALARGIDEREVEPGREAKSIGSEQTFEEDLLARDRIRTALLAQSTRVAARLVEGALSASRVTVKIKYADFRSVSRQTTLGEPASDTDTIYRAACELLERFELDGARVRLVGVSVSSLTEAGSSPVLFPDERAARGRKLEAAKLALKARFGDGGITRGALLEAEERAHIDPKLG